MGLGAEAGSYWGAQHGQGICGTEPKTCWEAEMKQVAFLKGVIYEEGPRFVGGPHLEQLADELSFIGGKDATNRSHCGLPDGAGEEGGSGAVSDNLSMPFEASGAGLAHSRRSVNICYIEMN